MREVYKPLQGPQGSEPGPIRFDVSKARKLERSI